jgi:hypothetical protein
MDHKGTRFATMEDIKSNATTELWKIPNQAFPLALSTMARSMKQLCVRAMVLF